MWIIEGTSIRPQQSWNKIAAFCWTSIFIFLWFKQSVENQSVRSTGPFRNISGYTSEEGEVCLSCPFCTQAPSPGFLRQAKGIL